MMKKKIIYIHFFCTISLHRLLNFSVSQIPQPLQLRMHLSTKLNEFCQLEYHADGESALGKFLEPRQNVV